MNEQQHNKIVSLIWGIADDVLRDHLTRGKYRDVILPMTVLRRLDAVLEPTKQQVLDAKASLDAAGQINQDGALRAASGNAFYNTSPFTMRDLKNRAKQATLLADFNAYLDGFSPNVQEIIECFKFRNQVPDLSKGDRLGMLIEKYLNPEINLSPNPVETSKGKLPGLDNHAMGTVFEELVRRFNEENNEEAGEHWTPRDAIKLMANLIFRPIADQIESGTYLLYDAAIGTGGMLTVAEDTLSQLAESHGKRVATHLYGQEVNPETYAICKADLLLKGDGDEADNIKGGSEYSTLSNDAFRSKEFDFMLSNPPYGKSWKSDLELMGGKKNFSDPRFIIDHAGDAEYSLVTRSSDGQLLFLANMLSKMKSKSKLGSRIAEVHNGSSLFTGDAGQGESNIRRWIIENDWLEAIVALPLNMFYNTGIATYIWVLTNKKPEHRQGKVQLIDATQWFQPLRKNLGQKNCELSDADVERICAEFIKFEENEQSRIFANEAFGYRKVTIERPLRLKAKFTPAAIAKLRFNSGDEELRSAVYDEVGDGLFTDFETMQPQVAKLIESWQSSDTDDDEESTSSRGIGEKVKKKLLDEKTWKRDGLLYETAFALREQLGEAEYGDFNKLRDEAYVCIEKLDRKLSANDLKAILSCVSWRDPEAPAVIAKQHKKGKAADPLHGAFEVNLDGQKAVVEYEPDSELRDTEQVPLLEEGGVDAFISREVLPYAEDSWIKPKSDKIGYEISFTKVFYKPPVLRSLDEIRADILEIEKESEKLLLATVNQ